MAAIQNARRRRFRIRAIVLAVLLVGLIACLSWWAIRRAEVATRRALIERVTTLGGAVTFQHQYDDPDDLSPVRPAEPYPHPGPLRRLLLGADSAIKIQAVRFPNGVAVDRAALKLLREVGEVRQLVLIRSLADNDTLRQIAGLESLRLLALNATNVTDEGLNALRELPNLREVALTYLPITDEGLRRLESVPSLQYVGAYLTRVTKEGVATFKSARPSVNVDWSNPRDDAHREALVRLERAGFLVSWTEGPEGYYPYAVSTPFSPYLTPHSFDGGWRGSEDDLQVLPDIPGIIKLRLSLLLPTETIFTDNIMPAIAKLAPLEELSLEATQITNDGLRKIAPLRRLKSLDLAQTRIGNEGLSHVASIKSLSKLRLYRTQVGNDGIAALKSLPNLMALDVSETRITEEAVDELAALRGLKELDVSGNGFSEEAYERLRARLPDCEIK